MGVVICTGELDSPKVEALLTMGADGVLHKPFDVEELHMILDQAARAHAPTGASS